MDHSDHHRALYTSFQINSFNPEPTTVGIVLEDWDIWSEDVERTGLYLLQLLRSSSEENGPVKESQLHVFETDESVQVNSLLTLILLVGWGAYYLPKNGNYFVYLSHDDVMYVVSEDKDVIEAWRAHWGADNVVDELPQRLSKSFL